MSASFQKLASLTASTKRATMSSGKRAAPTQHLTGLKVHPLDPVDPELRQRLALDTPHELLQTFVEGNPDIVEGDVLTVAGEDYPIRSVADWTFGADVYRHLVIENLKR
jgi:hypothetical protein